MNYLVTGCAGFIGSHLADRLLAQGHQVIGIDAFTSNYERVYKERNLVAALAQPGFRFIEANLNQLDLAEALAGVDVVFHLAGQPGVRDSWGGQFAAYAQNNMQATERLLHACVQHPVQRFVFAGSSSVYGDADELPLRETTCPQPRSPYAITKLAAEHLCQTYRLSFGVPTVILRYFTVYGPRQRPDMAFHRFLRAILLHQPIPMFGDGSQSRDFTYVDDIVSATIAAGATADAIGQIMNVGGGNRITMLDLLALLRQITGREFGVDWGGEQAGDVRHTWADTTRAGDILGFRPSLTLAEGLAREWAWIKEVVSEQ